MQTSAKDEAPKHNDPVIRITIQILTSSYIRTEPDHDMFA